MGRPTPRLRRAISLVDHAVEGGLAMSTTPLLREQWASFTSQARWLADDRNLGHRSRPATAGFGGAAASDLRIDMAGQPTLWGDGLAAPR
jgi:hypothetical protein